MWRGSRYVRDLLEDPVTRKTIIGVARTLDHIDKPIGIATTPDGRQFKVVKVHIVSEPKGSIVDVFRRFISKLKNSYL